MTQKDLIALGWTIETAVCYACGQPTISMKPPEHEKVEAPKRPQHECDAAKRANEYIREQTESMKNKRV